LRQNRRRVQRKVRLREELSRLHAGGGARLKFWFCRPVVQPDDFLHLAAFIPVFLGLGRPLLGLGDGMLGVRNGLVIQARGFGHKAFFFWPHRY